MLGSEECLRRAEELEQRARKSMDAKVRDELLKVAEGWRDLARRGLETPETEDSA